MMQSIATASRMRRRDFIQLLAGGAAVLAGSPALSVLTVDGGADDFECPRWAEALLIAGHYTIPLLGTPYFYDCLAEHRFLPLTKVRDLNSLRGSL
jgi:hypothetical protein